MLSHETSSGVPPSGSRGTSPGQACAVTARAVAAWSPVSAASGIATDRWTPTWLIARHANATQRINSGRVRGQHGQNETGLVVGRKAWMFYGTDTHAEAAAAIFSIIASCRLHGIDPFVYFARGTEPELTEEPNRS